jgi:hypothetical protein
MAVLSTGQGVEKSRPTTLKENFFSLSSIQLPFNGDIFVFISPLFVNFADKVSKLNTY